jgi:Transposase
VVVDFHTIRLANTVVDQVRRRVQQATLGHRGRKRDPLYRIRKLLTAAEQLTGRGRAPRTLQPATRRVAPAGQRSCFPLEHPGGHLDDEDEYARSPSRDRYGRAARSSATEGHQQGQRCWMRPSNAKLQPAVGLTNVKLWLRNAWR